jgi:UDP-N-acetylmuramyl pentapeptide synthase
VAQSGARVVHYAGEDSVVQLHNVRLNPFGQLEATWKGHHLKTQLIGRQYQVNLQAAIAVAQYLELTDQQIETAARTFQPSSSFIQGKILQTGAYIIDDGGTSNPKGFEAALTLLEELPYKEKILLTAGMIDLGDESHQIHLELAQRAQKMGVRVIHVGVDGKEEFAQVFGEELITSTSEAKTLLQSSHKDMLILLEGKVTKVLEDLIEELTERIV